jgi:hypothetical protein
MRGKYYYIVPHSTTTGGLSVGVEPITVLESGISDEIFGENIMAIFAFSKKNIPHPTNPAEWSQNLKPLLVAAKVRSWKAFMSGAELISLINIYGTIKLEPWINGGVTGPQLVYLAVRQPQPPSCSRCLSLSKAMG